MVNDGSVRELRLGVVCYGGVSLAVYMHGITKELRKLVVASRAYEADPTTNPFRPDQTEHAYFRAHEALGREVTVRVVIDVISGSSAGGINGVCLAQALAHDGDDSRLRDLWLEKGAIKGLLNSRVPGLPLKVTSVAAHMLDLDDFTPFKGDDMIRWLYDAIATMAEPAEHAHPTLSAVPSGHDLHLFVTATDLHGRRRRVPTGTAGATLADTTYRHVFAFTKGAGENTFDTAALALAARSTSSIPAVFPSVRLHEFAEALDAEPPPGAKRTYDLDEILRQHFAAYHELGADAGEIDLVDGGTLDNAPFDRFLDAVAAQRAQTQVVRQLLVLEPDPHVPPPGPLARDRSGDDHRGWFPAFKQATWVVQRHEQISAQLVRLRALNARVAMVGDIAHRQMDEVAALLATMRARTVAAAAGATTTADAAADVTLEELKALSQHVHAVAREQAGLTYRTYARLKLQDAVQRLTREISAHFGYSDDTGEAAFLEAGLCEWVGRQDAFADPTGPAAVRLLDRVDVGYRHRRLQFLLQGVNELYASADLGGGAPSRAEVDAAKGAVWDILDAIDRAPRGSVGAMAADVLRCVDWHALRPEVQERGVSAWVDGDGKAIGEVVAAYGDGLAHSTPDTTTRLWSQFQEVTRTWRSPQARRDLAVRFVAFPVWDTLIFPIVAMTATPQFAPIDVTRINPLETELLGAPDPDHPKLRGVGVHHFAAFFEEEWREHDYLWGRLDAAEMILRLLAGVPKGRTAGAAAVDRGLAASAFRAVLDSERSLDSDDARALRRTVSAAIDELAGTGDRGDRPS